MSVNHISDPLPVQEMGATGAFLELALLAHSALDREVGMHNLTYLQWRVLSLMDETEPMSVYQLSIRIERQQATTFTCMYRLEAHGWVVSVVGEDSVRRWTLTPKSRAVVPFPRSFGEWAARFPKMRVMLNQTSMRALIDEALKEQQLVLETSPRPRRVDVANHRRTNSMGKHADQHKTSSSHP